MPACTGGGGVYASMHWAGGVSQDALGREGVSAQGGGVSPQGGVLPGGCLPPTAPSLPGKHPHPCGQNDRQV